MTTTVFLYVKKQVYIQGPVTEIYIQFIRDWPSFFLVYVDQNDVEISYKTSLFKSQ